MSEAPNKAMPKSPRKEREQDDELRVTAVSAIGGLPSFAITTPSSWPITSLAAHIFTLGTVRF